MHTPSDPTPFIARARRGFSIGSTAFVAIGLLHTATHFAELSGSDLQRRFDTLGMIRVSGQFSSSWDLFQGTSLLMGAFSMGIGLISLGALRATARDTPPPTEICATNIAVLLAVIAVGIAHLGPLQIFGGLFGIAVFAPGLVAGRAAR